MAIASANTTRVAIIEEATWGTTPATPAFETLRLTSESLTNNRETIVSNELRGSDRNVSDSIPVGASAEGGIDFELSYGTYDDLLESFMANTWSSNVLTNGTSATPKSFTVEKRFQGTSDVYYRFTGMMVNQFSLNCQVRQAVTGSFSFVGRGGTVATTAISGATYASPTTAGMVNAQTDFASFSVLGLSTAPKIRSLTLEGTNNLRTQDQVGSFDAAGVVPGRFEVTGSMEAYLEDASLIEKFVDNEAGSLSFTLGGTANQKYTFFCPRIKIESLQVVAGGNDQDAVVQINWRAIVGTGGDTYTLRITRAVA
jgi:hypothetical protein